MKEKILEKFRRSPAVVSSSITVILVLCIVVAKSAAVFTSGSAAVLSALIDSLSDVGLSIMTLFSVRWSLKPADDNHRHGHGKIEGLAALVQGVLLFGGAVFLLFEASDRFFHPVKTAGHETVMILMGVSLVLSLVIARVQKLGAKHSDSLAVEADAEHYNADVIINAAVLIVIAADYFGFDAAWIDPLCAVAVAGIMAKTAYGIAVNAFRMLLDEELSSDQRHRILATIKSHTQVMGLHDLRTHQSGMRKFISFDIEVSPDLTVKAAHEIARDIEEAILLEFPQSEIMIHIDPFGDTRDSRHYHHHGHIEGADEKELKDVADVAR